MELKNFKSLPGKSISGTVLMFFLLVFSFTLKAQSREPESPKLIIRVVVEQMRYEMLLRYWEKFDQDGGFKTLIDNGLLCKNTSLGYAITDRSSGFATLASGADPSMHGIVSDYWYDRLSDKNVLCIEDKDYEVIGGVNGRGEYGYSPGRIFSTTLGDEMKTINERSKIYSVSLNPVSSVLGNGRLSDGAFWFDDKTGNWITSSYYLDSLPGWVNDFNNKGLQDLYMDRSWDKLMPDSNYTSSLPDKNDAEEGFLLIYRKHFPYDLSQLKNKSRSYKYLKYTPFGNTYTKDFALALMTNEELGMDDNTDLLNLSFASSSYLNDIFGPRSVEMEDMFLRMDKQLKHLLTYIEEKIGNENVLLVLTADRGCADSYEFRKAKRLPAKKFNPGNGITLLNSYLNIIYEEGNWIKAYANKQLYLDHGLIDQQGYSIETFQEKISRFMLKKSGVFYATKATTLKNTNFASGVLKRMQRSFHPKRSGDIFLALEPGTAEYPESTGSVFNYDNHIPLIWYGMNIVPGKSVSRMYLKDITPTISTLLNIPLPDASQGEPVKEVLDSFRKK